MDRERADPPESAGLAGLFEDLEQQAAGLALSERDAEIADRRVAEYARVALASRIHASIGGTVGLVLLGGGQARGTLTRAGADWCLVQDPAGGWLVRLDAVRSAEGLSPRSVVEEARPATAGLGFGAALRQLGAGVDLTASHVDGTTSPLVVERVGADFAETPAGLVAFASLAAVRVR